ncbi:hypothetical protein BGZ82_002147 [Podila clonocystis]|nr:hypothetical protein BGZ82_002147 [Podila clonocystis]
MDDNDEFGDENGFLGGDSGTGHEGDVASDQFARYLCQQITNNLPDKFGSSDEDEDEEEGNWIGEYGADSATNGLGPFSNDHAPDFDSDEDDDVVDEEAWNNPWPTTMGESKTPDSTSQSSATLSKVSQDVQDSPSGHKASEGNSSNGTNINDAPTTTTTNPDTTNGSTHPSTTPSDTSNHEVRVVTVPSSTTSTPTPALKSENIKDPEASTPEASTTTPTSNAVAPEGVKNGGDTTTHSEPRRTVTGATAGSVAISGAEEKKEVEEVTRQVKSLELEDKK